jgi:hypothetical protein
LFIFAGIIVANQANPRVRGIPFDGELGIPREIADGGYCEAVHDYSFDCCVARLEMIHPSRGRQSERSTKEFELNYVSSLQRKERPFFGGLLFMAARTRER